MTQPPPPTQTLGPDNWFEAWWLQRSEPVAPEMARDAGGEPLLSSMSLDEIGFVEAILSGLWATEHKKWDTPEAEFLRELRDVHFERGVAIRAAGGDVSDGEIALALPTIDHFGDRIDRLANETWRLERHPSFRDWLCEVVTATGFTEAAVDNVHCRRLAVTALRLSPSTETYDVVRAIYRNDTTHDAVVEADLAVFDDIGPQFREAVLEMGLHTPLHREPVYTESLPEGPLLQGGQPKLTVLIPSFKHEAFVKAAVRSALDQTRRDVVVLVVDDQSPDATVATAREIVDPRLTVRSNETNVGLGRSIQGSLSSIETPYVALLNSDDLFNPHRLERCLEVLEQDSEAAIVATGLDFIDGKGGRVTADTSCVVDVGRKTHGWLRWYEAISSELQTPDQWTDVACLLQHNHLATSSNIVARTDYLRELAGDFESLHYCIDWLLFLFAFGRRRAALPPPNR